MRKTADKGILMLWAGVLLIAAAICLVGYNLLLTVQAGKQAYRVQERLNSIIDRRQTDQNQILAGDMPVEMIDGKAYIGTLEMPALQLKLPVMNEWSYANLREAPCRYTGSAYTGDLILCAHNFDTHFGRIKWLSPGDGVIFTDVDGNIFHYRVVEIETLSPDHVDEMKEENYGLTLFTCTLGGAARVTVRCELSS